MQKIVLFLSLILCFSACKHRKTSGSQEMKNEFLITENRVGLIKKGTTVKELYNIYPEDQIKKMKATGEFANEEYDDFYLYTFQNKLLLIVSPEEQDDKESKINRVVVKDDRFVTTKGIRANSSVGEIKKAYEQYNFIPSPNEIILFVPEINGSFAISKKNLKEGWWDEANSTVNVDRIPDSTQVTELTIFWHVGKANVTRSEF